MPHQLRSPTTERTRRPPSWHSKPTSRRRSPRRTPSKLGSPRRSSRGTDSHPSWRRRSVSSPRWWSTTPVEKGVCPQAPAHPLLPAHRLRAATWRCVSWSWRRRTRAWRGTGTGSRQVLSTSLHPSSGGTIFASKWACLKCFAWILGRGSYEHRFPSVGSHICISVRSRALRSLVTA